jgi:PAS domain S-box-containing protein
MTITRRLKIAALVPAFLAALIGIALFASARVEEGLQERRTQAHRIVAGVNEMNNFVSSYVLHHEDRPQQQFLAQHEAVTGLMAALDVEDEAQRQALHDMRRDLAAAKGAFLRLVSHYANNPPPYRDPLFREVEERLRGQILIRGRSVVSSASRLDSLILREIAATERRTGTLVFLLVAGAAGVLTLGSLRMMQRITGPLDRLRRGTEIVGRGDLTHRIGLSSTDEIGRLAQAFDRMADNLRATTVSRDELAAEVRQRQRAERTLRASEERFRALVTASSEVLYRMSPDWSEMRRLDSRGFLATTERPSRTWLEEYIPPDDQPHVTAVIQEAIRTKSVFELEHRVRRADGSLGWTFSRAVPLLDANGEIVEWFGSASDITEAKQAEEALREAHERAAWLARFPEENPNPVLRVSAEGMVLYCNPAAAAVTAWACEIGGLLKEPFLSLVTRAMTEGREVWQDVGLGEASYLVWAVPFPAEHYANLYGRDLTERKRAEEALQEANEQLQAQTEELQTQAEELRASEESLRESEEQYRSLFKNMLDGYAYCQMLFDGQGRPTDFRYLQVNDVFTRLTGLENVVGKRVTEVIPALRESHPELLETYGRVALTGRPERLEIEFQPLGIWLLISVYSPRKGYFTAVFDDITERKQAEDALREWNATLESKVAQRTAELTHRTRQLQKLTLELSQAEERERRRIAVLLHEDLQQQIAGAKFHLNLLRGRARDDRQRAEVDRVDAMLKEAIEKSRSLSHDLSPAVLHLNDLAEVLRWLVNRVRAQHGLIARVDVPGEMTLQSEPLTMFLFRAAQEMLFNVVKHARVKEAALRVRRLGRYVGLSVSDQGRGFDPRELKETPGFGLLSLRERTELLGGRMKIASAKGQGSTFRIVVPDSPKPKDSDQTATGVADLRTLSSAVCPPSSGGVLRVLLVDDHDIVRQGLASLLQESLDIVVVGQAADGREAIDMTHALRPDVVIMDIVMPLMSGEEATRQIKRHLPNIRVIGLSMYDEPDKMETMCQAGAEGYVLKTASSEELLAAIRGHGSEAPEPVRPPGKPA